MKNTEKFEGQKIFIEKERLEERVYITYIQNKVFYYKNKKDINNPEKRPYLITTIEEYKKILRK